VTLRANSIAGALYKNKFGNSNENRNGQCQLQCLLLVKQWPNQKSLQTSAKYQQLRCSWSWIAADRLFSAHFQSFVVP